MKCTWIIGDSSCHKETGQPCPPEWIKHQKFDPRTLGMFFQGIPGEECLPLLKAFVCPDCMPQYEKYLRATAIGQRGAQTRKQNKLQTDYSI